MFRKLAVFLFVMLLAIPALADDVSTKYITVDLPDNWKAVMPPTENQGVTTVIFTNAAGNSTVNFVTGPNGGADLKTVAETFASQFKSLKPPVEKGGQFTFAFGYIGHYFKLLRRKLRVVSSIGAKVPIVVHTEHIHIFITRIVF